MHSKAGVLFAPCQVLRWMEDWMKEPDATVIMFLCKSGIYWIQIALSMYQSSLHLNSPGPHCHRMFAKDTSRYESSQCYQPHSPYAQAS